jgi:hypothetical protein
MEQDQEVPELYDDDPKRVMTYSSAAIESSFSPGALNVGTVTTMTPPRGSRHPQASPVLAPKCRAFARRDLCTTSRTLTRPLSPSKASKTRSRSRQCRSIANTRIPHRPLIATRMDKGEKPPPLQRRSSSSRLRSPPSRAAALTSISHPRVGMTPPQRADDTIMGERCQIYARLAQMQPT